MKSIASREFVTALGVSLAERIPVLANGERNSFKPWTNAVYVALREFADHEARRWTIFPSERCYAGEYLCDFMLMEPGYGCRVACESQWLHSGHNHQADLDWAFDKLRGVKSDVKLFIFEGRAEQWKNVVEKYLRSYAQLSSEEAFVALRYEQTHFIRSWWSPSDSGAQEGPIDFNLF